jgi:hypothetical protein
MDRPAAMIAVIAVTVGKLIIPTENMFMRYQRKVKL